MLPTRTAGHWAPLALLVLLAGSLALAACSGPTVPASWRIYRTPGRGGYSFRYPPNWAVQTVGQSSTLGDQVAEVTDDAAWGGSLIAQNCLIRRQYFRDAGLLITWAEFELTPGPFGTYSKPRGSPLSVDGHSAYLLVARDPFCGAAKVVDGTIEVRRHDQLSLQAFLGPLAAGRDLSVVRRIFESARLR